MVGPLRVSDPQPGNTIHTHKFVTLTGNRRESLKVGKKLTAKRRKKLALMYCFFVMNEWKGLYFSNREKETACHRGGQQCVKTLPETMLRCWSVCEMQERLLFNPPPPWISFLCDAKVTLEVVWLQVYTQCGDSSSESKVPSLFPGPFGRFRGENSIVYLFWKTSLWLSLHRESVRLPLVSHAWIIQTCSVLMWCSMFLLWAYRFPVNAHPPRTPLSPLMGKHLTV